MLFSRMHALGLTRVHMSFMQFSWQGVRTRLRRLSDKLVILDITDAEEVELYQTRFAPHSDGIRVQTCTATSLLERNLVARGACFGWEDVVAIAGAERVGKRTVNKTKNQAGRLCTCYPFKDAGCQRIPCKHGCRYCFMNPKIDW
jgi:hypothetical protein